MSTAVAAAAGKALRILAFVGLLALFGIDLDVTTRILIGLGLVLHVAADCSSEGHRLWTRRTKRTRYDTAA